MICSSAVYLRVKHNSKNNPETSKWSEQMPNAMLMYHRRSPSAILLQLTNWSSWRHSETSYAIGFQQDRKIMHLTHQNVTQAIFLPDLLFLFWDNLLVFWNTRSLSAKNHVSLGWKGLELRKWTVSDKVHAWSCLSLRDVEKIVYFWNMFYEGKKD